MFNPQDDNTIKVTTSFKVNNADGEDWETGDDIVSKEDVLTIENHKNICKNSFPVLYLK